MGSSAQEEKVHTNIYPKIYLKKRPAKNFNYYFGLAHKTHEKLHIKGSPDAKCMPQKLEHFPKSKSTFHKC